MAFIHLTLISFTLIWSFTYSSNVFPSICCDHIELVNISSYCDLASDISTAASIVYVFCPSTFARTSLPMPVEIYIPLPLKNFINTNTAAIAIAIIRNVTILFFVLFILISILACEKSYFSH